MKDIVDTCKSNEVTDLVVVHEHRGEPDGLIITHFPYGPTAYFTLYNVVMRHDIKNQGTVSEAYPHLIFDNFDTKLGQRVSNILKYLFPVPKPDSKRVMSFVNKSDYISFRHHVYHQTSHKEVHLAEVGPRFEMRLYQIKLGTVDLSEADTEWVLRPYQRTAKKRDDL
jgi:U3 small nucleolar ribonucleoprotein protein IMP4